MRDVLPVLGRWYAAGVPFGLATVVGVSRSAPRDPGAAMAVGPDDEVVGSVSGGCVEGAVFELAREVVADGEARLETFGYSDEDAFAVGLTCGGEITLLVRPVTPELDPAFGEVAAAVEAGEPVTVAYLADTDTDGRTVICVLTHDPKFDVPLLTEALRRPAAYIGAMGSRRTHEDRAARLREAGLTEAELSRLRSPVGLDLGARTPEEVAVSVAAEIVALRWGGSGAPLTATRGAVHPPRPHAAPAR